MTVRECDCVSLVLVSYLLFISLPPDLLTDSESGSVSDSASDSLVSGSGSDNDNLIRVGVRG